MRERVERTGLQLLPVLAVGLFGARILSEWLRPGLSGALLISFIALVVAGGLYWLNWVRPRPGRSRVRVQTEPLYAILLATPFIAYLFYPEADPRIAVAMAVTALLLWLFHQRVPDVAPVHRRALQIVMVAALGVAFLALYIMTLAPDVLPADNGEFQLVAATLGVAHPPGYPLYTLLAHLMTRLPLGPTPAYRVNLFAALTSTLTLLIVFLSVQRLTDNRLAGLIAALALGVATTFWAQATTANIRSMTVMFAAAAFLALIVIGREALPAGEPPAPDQTSTDRLRWTYVLFALALGFGITHHVSLIFMAGVWILFVLLADAQFRRSPRRWLLVLFVALLGLLPLIYLPLRAGADVPGATPALATVTGFLDHFLARGFSGDFFYFTTPALLWERLRILGNVLTFQFSPLLLIGALIGLLLLFRDNWKIALLLGGSFAIHTLVSAVYRAPQTVEYMLPAYIPVAICLGYAASRFLHADHALAGIGRLLAAILLLAISAQGITNWSSFRQLHTDFSTRTYAESLLNPAPTDALLLSDWHWITPIWYSQEVEGTRSELEARYVFPEGEPYAVTWARRIGAGLDSGRDVIATHYDGQAYEELPPPEPLAEAFWFRQAPRTALPAGFTPIELTLGDAIQVIGYRLEPVELTAGSETLLTLAWAPASDAIPAGGPEGTAYALFAHLVGADGRLYAQVDVPAVSQSEGITLTQLRLTPRLETLPGAYAVAIGAYEVTSNAPLLNDNGDSRTTLDGSVEVSLSSRPPYTQQRTDRLLAEGSYAEQRLVGFDWDNTVPGRVLLYQHWQTGDGFYTDLVDVTGDGAALPDWYGPWGQLRRETTLPARAEQQYVPLGQGIVFRGSQAADWTALSVGDTTTLAARFAGGEPIARDLVVSVRLVGYEEDGFHWAWWDLHDGVPAWGAIPTLKWIAGSEVRDPHPVTVSDQAYPGQELGGILLLYDAFTNRQLPILDAGLNEAYLGIPLGASNIAE